MSKGAASTSPSSATVSISGGAVQIQAPSSASSTPYGFTRSLQFRDRDPDVKHLQQFLNTHDAIVTSEDGGSPGNETDFFGVLTYKALIRFQNAHADQILRPLGLSAGTGFFGAATRAYVNALPN